MHIEGVGICYEAGDSRLEQWRSGFSYYSFGERRIRDKRACITIPAFEKSAMDQKHTMLLELTNTAWSILNKYHNDEVVGTLTREEAQKKAVAEVEALRYGTDKKDYFWITDMTPAMIMHPYVHKLNGKSLTDFADPDGKKLFIEARELAKNQGEGFIRYKWQFMDDSAHIVPKLSFVKTFSPWNWIVGTGIYIDDVEKEITSLTRKLVLILLGITTIITLFIFFIAYQSLKIETSRMAAEAQLRESREKYRSLLESSTEGIILLVHSRISYSNTFIQNWLDYPAAALSELSVSDIICLDKHLNLDEIHSETRLETDVIKRNGQRVQAVLTILPVQFAGKEGLLLTFRDISEQRSVKSELADIQQRLRLVSDHSGIGLFRFPLKGKNRLMEFNLNMVRMLGYSGEQEFKEVSLKNILEPHSSLKEILRELKKQGAIIARHMRLRKKDDSSIEVTISLILTEGSDMAFCDGIVELQEARWGTFEGLPSHIPDFLYAQNEQPAIELAVPASTCPAEASAQEALDMMVQRGVDKLLVTLNNKCVGILTSFRLLANYAAGHAEREAPCTDYMQSPVIFFDETSTISDAVGLMNKYQVSQIVFKNREQEPELLLSRERLSGKYLDTHREWIRMANKATGMAGLSSIRKMIPALVTPLIREQGNVRSVSAIISEINEAITLRIIEDTLKEVGIPPVPFAFFHIGSAARGELALSSDQDNALVYQDVPSEENATIQRYFVRLAEIISRRLDQTGLPLCSGGYMASNPKWCQPLSAWKNYFTDWIDHADAENILNVSVFFDRQFISGSPMLLDDLEEHIFQEIRDKSAFFYFLARNAAGFKAPINVFGNILTESGGKKGDLIDLKHPIATIVAFVRIFSLHHNVRANNTIDRVNGLRAKGVFTAASSSELIFQFLFLNHLRQRAQMSQLVAGIPADNHLDLKKMTEMDQIVLKKVFSQMNSFEDRLSAAFMSTYKG